MNDETPIYDRDNLPEEYKVAGGAAWTELVLQEPLRAIKIDGPFEVRLPLAHALRDSVGTLKVPMGGWVGIDTNGDPFPMEDQQVEAIYTASLGAETRPEDLSAGDLLAMLTEFVEKQDEGSIGLGFGKGEWSSSTIFGREAPDSPMAGGASYGSCDNLRDCLFQMAQECGLVPR